MEALDLRAPERIMAELIEGTVDLPEPFRGKLPVALEGFVGEADLKHGA